MMNTDIYGNMLESAAAKVTTAGDMVYATGANALARLPIGTNGQFLTVTAGALAWGAQSGVTNASIVTAFGATTAGDTFYYNGTNIVRLGIGTARQNLQTNTAATAPTWAPSSSAVLTTTGDILYASAANTLARRAIGGAGTVLTVSGGIPVWAAAGAPGTHASSHLPNSGTDALATGAPSSVGTANATGSASAFARQDHIHSIGTGAINVATMIANSLITDTQIAAANKDGVTGTASMRTLGGGAQQAAAGTHNHNGVYDVVGHTHSGFATTDHNATHEEGGADPIINTIILNNAKGLQLREAGGTSYWAVERNSSNEFRLGDVGQTGDTRIMGPSNSGQLFTGAGLECRIILNNVEAFQFSYAAAGSKWLYPRGGDANTSLGVSGNRWSAVWAANGAIQTSLSSEKGQIKSLDPSEALAAVLSTDFFTYRMKRPPNSEDGIGGSKEAVASRRRETLFPWVQVGFMAEDAHPLLSPDQRTANSQTTASVALAAIKALYKRIEQLEGKSKQN